MGLTKYEGAKVTCKEIKSNQQYWETEDGEFGVWAEGLTYVKDAKLGDKGTLHYWALSPTCGLWRIASK